MAVSTLTTAVDNLIDRIVTLQPLSIAEITPSTPSSKQWVFRHASAPAWNNRPSGLANIDRRDRWQLSIVSRLTLTHIAGATVGADTPQELMWQYLPETLVYFDAIRLTLAPAGYAEIDYIDVPGLTIASPRGVELQVTPAYEALFIEFNIVVPFSLVTT
jgi:hypothetical protein